MNIKETFLLLTNRTYPCGTEYELFDKLPTDLLTDEFGNLYIKIGDSDVMFTAHLDTATSALTKINHVITGDTIKTDGTTILGADDKAGVTIMLYMIENKVPGLYYFFLAEEVGCIGSRKLASKHKIEKIPYINKVIAFDRKDKSSVINYMIYARCCSDKFADELSRQLNLAELTFRYNKDETGGTTDSTQFMDIYPEVTNISVGYSGEHTFFEYQDIDHLERLAEACLKIDWNALPVERDPSVTEYRFDDDYGYDWFGHKPRVVKDPTYKTYDDWDEYYAELENKDMIETRHFRDPKYNYLSSFTINRTSGEYININISDSRFNSEIDLICKFIDKLQVDYSSMKWDGVKLVVRYSGDNKSTTTRKQLIEFLDELDLVKLSNHKTKDDYIGQI